MFKICTICRMQCRLCLKQNVEVENIFNSKLVCSELTLIESLYWVFGVEVDINDPYPKYICMRCENVVQYVGSYRTLYRRNQLKFKEKIDIQYENEQWKYQITEHQENCTASLATNKPDLGSTKKKRDFIRYYYGHRTTALQELIKGQYLKTNYLQPTKTLSESLFSVNDVVNVEVCKYCSQIFTTKTLLDSHCRTKHSILNLSDKPLKLKIVKRKRKKKFMLHLKKRKTPGPISGIKRFTVLNNLQNRPKNKLLLDTKNFPNLNFVKQLDKRSKESALKKMLKNHPKNMDLTKENVPETDDKIRESVEIKTITIDDEYQSGSEENTRELLNDRYKWLDLKDFTISLKKCMLPPGYEIPENVEQKKNADSSGLQKKQTKLTLELVALKDSNEIAEVRNEDFLSAILKINNIQTKRGVLYESIKTHMTITPTSTERESSSPIFAHDDVPPNNEKGQDNLKQKYKHLNLRDLEIPLKRCAVPSTQVEPQKKEPNAIPGSKNNAEELTMQKWKDHLSSMLLKAQQIFPRICHTNLMNVTNNPEATNDVVDKQPEESVDPPLETEDPSNTCLEDNTVEARTTENPVKEIETVHLGHTTKWPHLKQFCITLKRCPVPKNYEDPSSQTTPEENEDIQDEGVQKSSNAGVGSVKKKRKLHTKSRLKNLNSDPPSLVKNYDITIPKIDPLGFQQELVTGGNRELNGAREEMSQSLDGMPKLKSELRKVYNSSRNIVDRPPLLEPQVQKPPIDSEDSEGSIVLPNRKAYMKSNRKRRNSLQSNASSTRSLKSKPCRFRHKIQRRKISCDEIIHMVTEIKQLSDSLNSINITEKRGNSEGNLSNTETKNDAVGERLHNDPNILEPSNLNSPIALKNIVRSCWSDIVKDHVNTATENLDLSSSDARLSNFDDTIVKDTSEEK